MGMAASQARYLALVARKSNCEYEGQQINQARLVLSNQTANLFNQMLGLQVPVPPSTQDFTKTQYSFKTGASEATIDAWDQLANPEPDYNYVVSYHYYNDVYTGSQKRLVDPQVQFSSDSHKSTDMSALNTLIRNLTLAKEQLTNVEAQKTQLEKEKASLEIQKSTLSSYSTTKYTNIKDVVFDEDAKTYTFKANDPEETAVFTAYDKLADKTQADEIITLLQSDDYKLLSDVVDYSSIYFDGNGNIAFKNDLDKLTLKNSTSLAVYNKTDIEAKHNDLVENITNLETSIATLTSQIEILNGNIEIYDNDYKNKYNSPTYIGNCALTLLETLDTNQEAELAQVFKDMKTLNPDSNFFSCFDNDGNYVGGIYSFKLQGITYYTTLQDLESTWLSGSGINNIDGQDKLYYYNATYVKTKFEKKEKALLETDSNGRFTSVRFSDDSIAYSLNVEQITDDEAYKDAMNQFNYETAKYAKMVQDINAKTSIIQQEDRTLELRLKQLDTEQNALTQEMDAVQKVVKDNVEKSFKTFGG